MNKTILSSLLILLTNISCNTVPSNRSPGTNGAQSEIVSRDFGEFFLLQAAFLGSLKTPTRNFEFPEASWTSKSDSNGFVMDIEGLTFEEITDFLRDLYGEPRSELEEASGYSHQLYVGETVAIQVFTRNERLRIVCVRRFNGVGELFASIAESQRESNTSNGRMDVSPETGSGDFVQFFLQRIASMGHPKTKTASLDFPQATWTIESTSNGSGFAMNVYGLTFGHISDFIAKLYGEPRVREANDGELSGMFVDEEVLIQFVTTEDRGVRIAWISRNKFMERLGETRESESD